MFVTDICRKNEALLHHHFFFLSVWIIKTTDLYFSAWALNERDLIPDCLIIVIRRQSVLLFKSIAFDIEQYFDVSYFKIIRIIQNAKMVHQPEMKKNWKRPIWKLLLPMLERLQQENLSWIWKQSQKVLSDTFLYYACPSYFYQAENTFWKFIFYYTSHTHFISLILLFELSKESINIIILLSNILILYRFFWWVYSKRFSCIKYVSTTIIMCTV